MASNLMVIFLLFMVLQSNQVQDNCNDYPYKRDTYKSNENIILHVEIIKWITDIEI